MNAIPLAPAPDWARGGHADPTRAGYAVRGPADCNRCLCLVEGRCNRGCAGGPHCKGYSPPPPTLRDRQPVATVASARAAAREGQVPAGVKLAWDRLVCVADDYCATAVGRAAIAPLPQSQWGGGATRKAVRTRVAFLLAERAGIERRDLQRLTPGCFGDTGRGRVKRERHQRLWTAAEAIVRGCADATS